MKLPSVQTIIEQVALLFASLIWTIVVLTGISMFWAYQDIQARWEFIINTPPEALAQAAATPLPMESPRPTATVWQPPITPTPIYRNQPPTPIPTLVVQQPDILPETLNPGEENPLPEVLTEAEPAPAANAEPTAPPPIATEPQPETNTQAALPPTPTSVPPTPLPTATPPPMEIALPGNVEPTAPPQAAQSRQPTHLIVPSVGIDAPIIPVGWNILEQGGKKYSVWQVADFAVGWHQTSAGLGQPGNTVMAGHHNVKGEVFRDLVNVEVGDTIISYAGEQKFEYRVEMKTIVKEKGESLEVRKRNAQWIAPTDDQRLTLVTCWPYTNNTHRVIVIARPI